jgi:hypothetical protein
MATTETTSTSWFSRIGNSIKGVFFGIILLIAAPILLFWNEKRTVDTTIALAEGKSVTIAADPAKVDPKNEGKLIHVSGMASTKRELSDDVGGVSLVALRLKRTVEVYQWIEHQSSQTKDKIGGGQETTTTYTYDKKWSDRLVDSTSFKEKEGHINPTEKSVDSQEWTVDDATIGAFTVSPTLLGMLSDFTDVPMPPQTETLIPGAQSQRKMVDNKLYLNTMDPAVPVVGDTRVFYTAITPQDLSIIALQRGSTFDAYKTKNGQTIQLIEQGNHSIDEMFANAQAGNMVMAWILRVVGVLLIFIGFNLILGVLPAIAMVLPFFGRFVGGGMALLAFFLTVIVASIVIALAWFAARPILSLGLVVVIVIAIVLLMKRSTPARAS